MSERMEHNVVVVFDIEANSRHEAYEQFATYFARSSQETTLEHRLAVKKVLDAAGVESWWFPEPDVKRIDGNDNAALVLVPVESQR